MQTLLEYLLDNPDIELFDSSGDKRKIIKIESNAYLYPYKHKDRWRLLSSTIDKSRLLDILSDRGYLYEVDGISVNEFMLINNLKMR